MATAINHLLEKAGKGGTITQNYKPLRARVDREKLHASVNISKQEKVLKRDAHLFVGQHCIQL